MNFTLRKPCAECPFRNDRPGYLHPERAEEIANAVLAGSTFTCHKTTECVEIDEDGSTDMVDGPNAQMCAGARAFQHAHGVDSQLERIARRLGMPVANLDDDLPVYQTIDEFIDAQIA